MLITRRSQGKASRRRGASHSPSCGRRAGGQQACRGAAVSSLACAGPAACRSARCLRLPGRHPRRTFRGTRLPHVPAHRGVVRGSIQGGLGEVGGSRVPQVQDLGREGAVQGRHRAVTSLAHRWTALQQTDLTCMPLAAQPRALSTWPAPRHPAATPQRASLPPVHHNTPHPRHRRTSPDCCDLTPPHSTHVDHVLALDLGRAVQAGAGARVGERVRLLAQRVLHLGVLDQVAAQGRAGTGGDGRCRVGRGGGGREYSPRMHG